MGKLIQRLQDPARSGVYRVAGSEEVLEAVKDSGLALARVAFAEKPRLMKNFARALDFPGWFGENWDALEDCLTDLSWRPADGHILLVEGATAGDDLGVLIDVLRSSAEFWTGRGKPFFAIFIDPQRAMALPDLFRHK